ncbi:MAG: radical SAM protein [Thermodesulfovibrionia bacterium]|nr:radical SAM protein [Thermodesulfovibrionia bacterium]
MSLYKRAKLLHGLLTGEVAKTGPFFVDIDLTNRCNLKCLGCTYHSSDVKKVSQQGSAEADISVDLFKDLCKELKIMGTESLIFHGSGEPFLHNNILDMLSIAKESGFHVTIITNGTLLDMDMLKSLIGLRLDTLKVSLWASSIDGYRKNYPGTNPDYFDKVINTLKLLTSLKASLKSRTPLLQLHHPINRHNYKTIGEFTNLALDTGCNILSFSPFWTVKGQVDSAALSKDEEEVMIRSLRKNKERLKYLTINDRTDDTLLKYRLGSSVWKKVPCYVAWYHARVRVDGKVQPCGRCLPEVNFGNLNNDTLHDIWNGESIRSFRSAALDPRTKASMLEGCDCNYCCFAVDNMKVHRIFKWIPSFFP